MTIRPLFPNNPEGESSVDFIMRVREFILELIKQSLFLSSHDTENHVAAEARDLKEFLMKHLDFNTLPEYKAYKEYVTRCIEEKDFVGTVPSFRTWHRFMKDKE